MSPTPSRQFARLTTALAVASLLVSAGCESGDGDGDSDTTTTTTTSTTATTTTTTTTPPGGGGDDEPAALAGITAAHNEVRAGTGAGMPDLVWDADIAAFAQEWADELAARGCPLEHRPRSGEFEQQYGENLFWGSGGSWSPQDVVSSWASEEADYDYENNSCSKVCGHYTQIVWANSTKLGCASASCGSQIVYVCNYDPPGNFNGQRPY